MIGPIYDDIDISFNEDILQVVRDGVSGYITTHRTWVGEYLKDIAV